MKKQFTKRILSWFLAAVMTLGMVVPMGAANTSDGAKVQETNLIVEKVGNDTVSVDLSDKFNDAADEDEIAADTEVRVSIILTDAATTAKFSTENIAENSAAMQYRASLEAKQDAIAEKISKEVLGENEKLDIVWNLTLAADIISANVKYGDIAAIEKIPGVQEVVLETRYEPMVVDTDEPADPNTATSGVMTGTFTAYAEGYTGAGSRVAIIDTGIDTDHQSFDNGAFLYSLEEGGYDVTALDLLDVEEIASVLDQLNAYSVYDGLTAEALYRNEKEPFNFNYIDENLDVQHILSDEHGAHVAGIAAANAYIPDGNGGYVSALDSVKVQGAAPDAQILTMRVFGQGGVAYDSDYMAAIEDAVMLGCDSVNLSLGSGNPGFSKSATAAYAKIMDDLQNSGTVVTMSAGNSSYWAEEAYPLGYLYAEDVSMQMDGSPGSFDNSFTVASADNIGYTGTFLTVDGKNVFYNETAYSNEPITTIGGDHEFVYVDGNGTDEDFAAVADQLVGKIAVCNRGGISFYQKAENAVQYGAIATIVANNTTGTINMDLSDYTKTAPVVSITMADGALLKAAATSNETIGGNTVYFGTLTVGSTVDSSIISDYVKMSSFSSWGVPGSLTLKPEITAPGGSIYSVNGAVEGGKSYETMSGTSMASPQIAGISALVAQYIDENDLVAKTGLTKRALTQSLLMSTATPLFDYDNDAYYYSVLQQGAGLVDVGAAVKAESYILMDESATDSANDGKVKAELGDDPARTGKYTVKFSVNNISGEEMNYVLAANMFTQAPFRYYVNADRTAIGYYMDTTTTPIGADVEWLVNGVVAEAPDYDLLGMDFDGNGVINDNDADAMLDFVVGNRDSLNDQENADLDGDGEITSYDVYLFLQRLSAGAFTVPANGSVDVVANITLDAEDMEALDYLYPNGAYVEGYIYVKSLTSDDGEIGVTHSIPVLGFYGDWSDASMYEHGQRITYYTGEDLYTPYLGSYDTNTLAVTYAGDSGAYYFTGNPLLGVYYNFDIANKYMPERNAINSADTISNWKISLIRNAAKMQLAITDSNGNKLVDQNVGENVASAYYYSNGSTWRNTYATLRMSVNAESLGLSEGDTFNVKLSAATEYSVAEDGSVDWDNLGDGASMEYPFTVDNTAPVLEKVTLEKDITSGNMLSLHVTASDNQYIAGVVLLNGGGSKVLSVARYKDNIQPGESAEYVLPLDDVNGSKFVLQILDYASNAVTYTIREQIGEPVPAPDAYFYLKDADAGQALGGMSFDADGKTSFANGEVIADAIDGMTAMEDVNGILITSTEDGSLYALRVLEPSDVTLITETDISFADLAYDATNDVLYGVDANYGEVYTVDYLNGTIATTDYSGDAYVALAAHEGVLYGLKYDKDAGETTLYKLENGTETALSSFETDAPSCMEWKDGLVFLTQDAFTFWGFNFAFTGLYRITDTENGVIEGILTDGAYDDYNVDFFAVTNKSDDESWSLPKDDAVATGIYMSPPDDITLIRGNTQKFSAQALPWTLEDRSVIWSSSDPTVATVSSTGVVTAVEVGETVITAAVASDPTITASCTVTVEVLPLYLEGALQDADANPMTFTWDVLNEETWTMGVDINSTIGAITSDGENLFVIDTDEDNQTISKISLATGETLESASGASVPFWDMAYTTVGSEKFGEDRFLSVYGTYVIPHNLTPTTSAYNLSNWLAQTSGANYFVGIASYYVVDDTQEYFLLIDDAGYLWLVNYFWNETNQAFTMRYLTSMQTNLTANDFDFTENHPFTSLVVDPIYNMAYLSAYNSATETNELTFLQFSPNAGYGIAAKFGDVGEKVWPAGLYHGEYIDTEDTTALFSDMDVEVMDRDISIDASADVAEIADLKNVETSAEVAQKRDVARKALASGSKTTSDAQSYADMLAEIAKGQPTGSLNGFIGTVRPNSSVVVDKDNETNVILNLTAKDADGRDIASHNGKSVVTYDPTTLKLVAVNSIAAHYAYNDVNGVITFAYADLATIAAGEPVATFVFERIGGKNAGLKIDYIEVNNEKIGASEDITDICQHERTIIKNAVPATPFRPGYTGDKYCAICGKLLARGQYLPILVGPSYPTNPKKDDTPKEDEKPVEPTPVEEPETEPVTPVVPEKELPFVDVVKDHWFYEDVLYVYENGLMNGVSDTEFAPNETLTRAMVVTILSRMSGEEIAEATESAFSDVATGMWYSNAIAWAASKNIVNGFEDGTFQPDAPVTRAQLVTILYRYAQYKGMDVSTLSDLSQFTDAADVPAYALEAMQWAVGSELLSGNGLLIDASANATRAQVAAIIHRFLTK